MAKKYDHLVKLMLIGDSGVGKTAILVRFVDNEFTPSFMTTIGKVLYERIIFAFNAMCATMW